MAEEHAAERAGKGVGVIMAGISLRVELERLRDRMRAVGMTHEEIAAEFSRRYRLRPRPAFRHAHGWTLQLAADRINARAADLDIDPQGTATMTVPRLSELENWPNSARRRPTPQILALLASVYGTDVHSLLDIADREHLRPEDRVRELRYRACAEGAGRARARCPNPPNVASGANRSVGSHPWCRNTCRVSGFPDAFSPTCRRPFSHRSVVSLSI